MIKIKEIKFNIYAFLFKTALAVVSIALTIILLLCFNQNVHAIRSVLFQNEAVGNSSAFMRFNDKEIGRVISGYIPTFIITKTIFFNACKFIAFIYADVFAVICVLIVLFFKKTQVESSNYSLESKPVSFIAERDAFHLFNLLNIKLTI